MTRRTPAIVADSPDRIDCFCTGDPASARHAGWLVVPVHDGWYADDAGGGVAVWGQGQFWEVRHTPFNVKEACGPADSPAATPDAALVDVRKAIFGA